MQESPMTVRCAKCKRRTIPEAIYLKTGECHLCTLNGEMDEDVLAQANAEIDTRVALADFEHLFEHLPDQSNKAATKQSRVNVIEDLKKKGY